MKKFLTVLLVIAVMFTFSFSSAFALPSADTDAAGLAEAQKAAIAELNDYVTLSDYTAEGQTLVKGVIASYTAKINDATTLGAITALKGNATTPNTWIYDLEALNDYRKLDGVQSDAKDQLVDYAYLVDLLDAKLSFDDTKAKKLTGFDAIGYDAGGSHTGLLDAGLDAIDAAVTVKGVEEVLNTYLDKLTTIAELMLAVEVSQDDIDALVAAIRTEAAANTVLKSTHSTTIYNAFEAAIDKGIAAAKAAKTWDEYVAVANEYLGTGGLATLMTWALTPADGYVYDHGNYNRFFEHVAVSKFEALANKTLDVEKQIKVVEKALSTIGTYDYATITSGDWEDAVDFIDALEYFVEYGDWETSAPGSVDISTIDKDSTATDVTAAAKGISDEYAEFTKLYVAKDAAKTAVNAFYGYEFDDSAAVAGDYSAANQTQITNLKTLACKLIDAATTADQVSQYKKSYMEKIDAVNTEEEQLIADNFNKACAVIDSYVAKQIKDVELTADQKALLDRLVADAKEALKEAPSTNFASLDESDIIVLDLIGGSMALEDVLTTPVTSLTPFVNGTTDVTDFGYDLTADFTRTAYSTINQGYYDAYVAAANPANNAAIKTWVAAFAAYDDATAKLEALPTANQEAYDAAVAAAEKAINALGTPAYTTAFASLLATAEAKVGAVATAKGNLVTELGTDARAIAAIPGIPNIGAYNAAVYEYAYLEYLDGLAVVPTALDEVDLYQAYAAGILDVIAKYTTADQIAILEAITSTDNAIAAAKTDAEKIAAANAAIAKFIAFVEDVDSSDYVEDVTKVKAEAVDYLKTYYNKAFTSEAANYVALRDDILAAVPNVVDATAKIAAVESLKIKASTKAYTGYIRLKWAVTGDAEAADGYQIYRSTKSSSGGKKIYTTKKATTRSFKNTSVKKGTKYYYKVRAFVVVDGVTYYSDWSTRGIRTAK